MPHDNDEHEPELWPYRKDFLISKSSLEGLLAEGVLDESRIVEMTARDDLGDRVGEDFTEGDFNALTGRDNGEHTRWLYDIGDPELDPLEDAIIASDNGFEASPLLLVTLSPHWTVMPGTTPRPDPEVLDLAPPEATSPEAHIAVVDSGYNAVGSPGWLADRVQAVDPTKDGDTSTGKWNGHGKFVASIIVQQNPNAFVWVAALKPVPQDKFIFWGEIEPDNPLDHFITDELALYSAVRRLLDRRRTAEQPDGPEAYNALNLSVGAWGSVLSISGFAIRAALQLWRDNQATAPILAAAGNHLEIPPIGQRFMPGQMKFPLLYGVKSLTQDEMNLSFFSNEAQIGATGEGLLGVLDDGKAAYWSGTSFATAVVSAEVVKTNPPVLPPPSVVHLEAHLATRLGTPPPTSANPVG